MSSEHTKTILWLVAAGGLSLVAFLNLPKRIELENQAKVNEPLFKTYQASNIWLIEIQKPPTGDFRQIYPDARVEELSIKRTANRGWELVQFAGYPAENTQRIGQLTTILNDLKVLEVVSESASESELAEFGLLRPEVEGGSETQKASRLRLSDAAQEVVADLLIGRVVPQQGQSAATVYVRPTMENAIYRVTLDKRLLSTSLVDLLANGSWLTWVNANPLGLQTPANVPATGPSFRVIEEVVVSTGPQGRPTSDPYRAVFRFGENVTLTKLATFQDNAWTEVSRQRLPANPEFTQGWRMGMEIVPAFFLLRNVKKKSEGLQQALRRGLLQPETDISELKELGYSLGTEDGETVLVGQSGQMLLQAQGGMKFRLIFGQVDDVGLVPIIVQASLAPSAVPTKPVLGELPTDAAEWPSEQRERELENLQREFNRRMEDWNRIRQQLGQDLDLLNERFATWIYFVPSQYALQAIPDIRLLKPTAPPAETGEVEKTTTETTASDAG